MLKISIFLRISGVDREEARYLQSAYDQRRRTTHVTWSRDKIVSKPLTNTPTRLLCFAQSPMRNATMLAVLALSTVLARLARLSICLPCSQSPCSPAKLHSCSTNCPASLHQASTVGSSRCPLCMNHNPFGVGSLGFHGSQGGQGQELGDSGFLLPGGATVCMRGVAIYIERLIETCWSKNIQSLSNV